MFSLTMLLLAGRYFGYIKLNITNPKVFYFLLLSRFILYYVAQLYGHMLIKDTC